MKAAEWKKVVKPLMPADEDWQFRGSLCYRPPLHWFLFGVLGEGSGFDKGVYIWHVTMPLFIPTDVIDLSWSERIGGRARKYDNLDEEAPVTAIIAVFDALGTEEDAVEQTAARGVRESRNRRVQEVVAYARILTGDLAGAREALTLAEAGITETPWGQEIVDRVELVRRLLDQKGHPAVVDQLDRWCGHTVGALGLRRSAAPGRRA